MKRHFLFLLVVFLQLGESMANGTKDRNGKMPAQRTFPDLNTCHQRMEPFVEPGKSVVYYSANLTCAHGQFCTAIYYYEDDVYSDPDLLMFVPMHCSTTGVLRHDAMVILDGDEFFARNYSPFIIILHDCYARCGARKCGNQTRREVATLKYVLRKVSNDISSTTRSINVDVTNQCTGLYRKDPIEKHGYDTDTTMVKWRKSLKDWKRFEIEDKSLLEPMDAFWQPRIIKNHPPNRCLNITRVRKEICKYDVPWSVTWELFLNNTIRH